MKPPETHAELTTLFKKLGAPEPESWAASQVQTGIPQLHRYLFLREAWKLIVPDDDFRWIDAAIERADKAPIAPYSGIGHALKRCLEAGADREDIKEIVRGFQASFLFHLCYLLEDPNPPENEAKDICWSLFAVNDGKPIKPISGLHESVSQADPSGREMRPKGVTKEQREQEKSEFLVRLQHLREERRKKKSSSDTPHETNP